MPFIKKKYVPEVKACSHPEHDPPGMIVLPAGVHTWQCPGCGKETTFTVHGVTM